MEDTRVIKYEYVKGKVLDTSQRRIDAIYITGAGYINYEFKGISADSALGWEEPVWGGELTRSKGDFVLTNIDTVAFGLVARCEVNFTFLSYEDYIVLCKMIKQRTVKVTFFNREKGDWEVNREMAFTETAVEKVNMLRRINWLGQAGETRYMGATGVSIKLVATNRENSGLIKNKYTLSYKANGGTGTIQSEMVKWSNSVKISNNKDDNGNDIMTNNGKELLYWSTKADGTGDRFSLDNEKITMWQNITLYAIWG